MTVSAAPAADRVRSRLRDPDLFRDDLFVAGAWTSSGDGARIEVVDPHGRRAWTNPVWPA